MSRWSRKRLWPAAGCVLCLIVMSAGCGGSRAPQRGTVTIDSVPPGATLSVKSEVKGITPLTLTDVEPGRLGVDLVLEGYERKYEGIAINPGENTTVTIQLERQTGQVSFTSEPTGAQVILDGEAVGVTPLNSVSVPTGDHKYVLQLANYFPAESDLSVERNNPYNRHHELKPMEATLTITSRPTGATIWLNDKRQEDKTPARYRLAPALYTIAVQRGGYLLADEIVTLGPNEDRKLEIEMQPGEAPEGMVLVPSGVFLMGQNGGAPDEAPQQEINLDAFYIDRYEVSNVEFQRVFPAYSFPEGQEEFPATAISFNRALEYANRVGKRLPTEAEWEKAARGADGREYPWGASFDSQLCNVEDSLVGKTVRRGKFLLGASPARCLDMSGNVYEWTSSWYEAYPGNQLITKDYGQVYRVLRGGSYLSKREEARCARRHFDRMDAARKDYGFRCVMDLPSDVSASP